MTKQIHNSKDIKLVKWLNYKKQDYKWCVKKFNEYKESNPRLAKAMRTWIWNNFGVLEN